MSSAKWNTGSGSRVIVFRLANMRFPANDGAGSRLHGGRWNHIGTPLVYASQSISLCALEVLSNSSGLPTGLAAIEIHIPDTIPIIQFEESELPPRWDSPIPSSATRDIGTNWARHGATAVLSVPSAIVPRERNYMLNPGHHDFPTIRFGKPEPLRFDSRLK